MNLFNSLGIKNNKHNFFIVVDLIGRLASSFFLEQIQYHWLKQHLHPNLDNKTGMVGVGHLLGSS